MPARRAGSASVAGGRRLRCPPLPCAGDRGYVAGPDAAAGSEILAQEEQGPTPLSLAAREEFDDVRQALVRNPNTPGDVLHWSVAFHDPEHGQGLRYSRDPAKSLITPVLEHPNVDDETLSLIPSQGDENDGRRARVLRATKFRSASPAGKPRILRSRASRFLL